MDQELKSEGKCFYCDGYFSQAEIGKHVAKHLVQMEKGDAGKNHSNYVHIEVEANEMFLHLLVKGNSPMKTIDIFLRKIWLECCGHMSEFEHKNFKISMEHRVEEVFQPRVKIFHDYDFGTTTRVFLKARKHYQLNLKEKIMLLSRNEPLKLMCVSCKTEPAINICTVCCYQEMAFFCEKCSKKHAETCEDFADYASTPIVNSPRMGECGYTGGTIDIERDGVYKIK